MPLNLLELNESYFHCPSNPSRSWCKYYKVSDLGKRLLRDEATEYLRLLHDDPQIRRKNQQNRSKRRGKVVPTGDVAVDTTKALLWDLKYDPEKVGAIMDSKEFKEKIKKKKGALDNINYSLLIFQRGDFEGIERNDKDGRIHHPWVLMQSDIRAAFYLNDLVRAHVVDIRACHPVFWANYIYGIYKCSNNLVKTIGLPDKESISRLVGGSHPISSKDSILPHYVGIDGDIVAKEANKWIAFWTDEKTDPREIIAQELGLKTKIVKKLINSALNGSRNRLFQWIRFNYPCLFKIWLSTNLKKTGNQISMLFETDIMLNREFLLFVESLEVRIIPEHDGFSVFANPTDGELDEKLDKIVKYLKDYSNKKFGVPIVVTTKDVKYKLIKLARQPRSATIFWPPRHRHRPCQPCRDCRTVSKRRLRLPRCQPLLRRRVCPL